MASTNDSSHDLQFENTNAWGTHQLVTMALMCAIGVILSFIEIPLFPAAPYLKYDPSAITAMVSGFAYGPGPGVAVGVVCAIIHSLIMSDFWGALMTILVIIGFVVPAALIYRTMHSFKGALLGLAASVVAAVVLAIVGNLLITPLYSGVPVEAVMAMIVPILTPFNLIKGLLNAVLTLVVYKSVSNLLTPRKKQVRGR